MMGYMAAVAPSIEAFRARFLHFNSSQDFCCYCPAKRLNPDDAGSDMGFE